MEFHSHLQEHWLDDKEPNLQDGRIYVGHAVADIPCYFLWRSLVLNSNGKAAYRLIYQYVAEYADLSPQHRPQDL
jgi:hypothetical protein